MSSDDLTAWTCGYCGRRFPVTGPSPMVRDQAREGRGMKPCLDCKKPARGSRCTTCTRAKDKARGTRQQRGYDNEHDKLRAHWLPLVATGHVKCSRCRLPIAPDAPWDLGHDDLDRTRYTGPEHEGCNRSTAGR